MTRPFHRIPRCPQPRPGTLHVVATPIGHRDDIGARAIETLRRVKVIAAEDTRHTRPLLQHLNIDTPLIALHDHNERTAVDSLVERMRGGDDIALVSDAGTPLISDPGFRLVRAARAAGLKVSPVPGPERGHRGALRRRPAQRPLRLRGLSCPRRPGHAGRG